MSYLFYRHFCSLHLLVTEGLHDLGYSSYLLRSTDLFSIDLSNLPWNSHELLACVLLLEPLQICKVPFICPEHASYSFDTPYLLCRGKR